MDVYRKWEMKDGRLASGMHTMGPQCSSIEACEKTCLLSLTAPYAIVKHKENDPHNTQVILSIHTL